MGPPFARAKEAAGFEEANSTTSDWTRAKSLVAGYHTIPGDRLRFLPS
jgi:hypothetical protein